MKAKGQLFRKLLEAYAPMKEYYSELAAEKMEIEYKRINVRGISYNPNRVPRSTPEYRSTALVYDFRLGDIEREMNVMEGINGWIWENLNRLDESERALVRDKYILCGSEDDLTAKYGGKDEIRAEIRRICRKIK